MARGRVIGARSSRRPATDARARAWTSMRILRRFTAPDLITSASVTPENAQKYLRELERAGFIRRLPGFRSGVPGHFLTFQLVRNAGPKAPICSKDGLVLDPNTGTRYGIDGEAVS